MTMPAGQCQPDKIVGGATAKPQHIATQPIPKAATVTRDKAGCKFHRQWAMTKAHDIVAYTALELIEDALNLKTPTVYDTVDKKPVVNAQSTEAARKTGAHQGAFQRVGLGG